MWPKRIHFTSWCQQLNSCRIVPALAQLCTLIWVGTWVRSNAIVLISPFWVLGSITSSGGDYLGNLFLSTFNLNFKISDLLFIFKHKSDSRITKSSQPSKFTTCLYCFTSKKSLRMEPCLLYLEDLARIIFHLGSSLNKGLLSVPSLVPFGYCLTFSEQELRSKPLFLI